MLDTTVPVNRPLNNPHATRRIRYRVQLKTNDPAQVFGKSTAQEMTSLDSRTAEIVVQAIGPKRGGRRPSGRTSHAAGLVRRSGRWRHCRPSGAD